VKETADKVLSEVKQVSGECDVLNKMIQLIPKLAEIGKDIPVIAPAFAILKVTILRPPFSASCDFFKTNYFFDSLVRLLLPSNKMRAMLMKNARI
jgi:hypothetical protein